jgi:hypothetical protein
VNLITLLSDTAYHSFIGDVEALNTTTIRRLTPWRRHQLLAIAPSSPFMGCPEKISVAPLCQCATARLGLVASARSISTRAPSSFSASLQGPAET